MLADLPARVQEDVVQRLTQLGEEPRGPGVLKLRSHVPPAYRGKVGGDYRIVFIIDDAAPHVRVIWQNRDTHYYRG